MEQNPEDVTPAEGETNQPDAPVDDQAEGETNQPDEAPAEEVADQEEPQEEDNQPEGE